MIKNKFVKKKKKVLKKRETDRGVVVIHDISFSGSLIKIYRIMFRIHEAGNAVRRK